MWTPSCLGPGQTNNLAYFLQPTPGPAPAGVVLVQEVEYAWLGTSCLYRKAKARWKLLAYIGITNTSPLVRAKSDESSSTFFPDSARFIIHPPPELHAVVGRAKVGC